jgi:hypothetical protein
MEIQIPCPKCGRELKLRDRSLLGRKGKCPKCEHMFVLEEPAVELELAQPEVAVATKPRFQLQGRAASGAAPWPATAAVESAPVETPPEINTMPMIPDVPVLGGNDGTAARLKAMQKKNAKRRNVGLAVGAVVLLAVVGVTAYALKYGTKQKINPDQVTEGTESDNGSSAEGTAVAAANAGAGGEEYAATSPTKGEKIELQFIPFGTQVMLNIRPAEIWGKDAIGGRGEELRYCMPPVAKLLETTFDDLFKRKPEQIEEAQICLIPGVQGSPPEIAAVIHLVEEAKKSQLLEDFGGNRIDDYDYPVYITGNRAYLIADQKTIAMCPAAQAKEMVHAVVGRNPAPDGIDELLPMTDRERLITVVFVPRTIRLHASWWFPTNVQPLVIKACDWFGDEVESAAWSFHLDDKTFYSDLILRNVGGVTSASLEREMHTKLEQLPHDVLDTIQMMNPKEAGKRKVIGRLPKMTEAFAMASEPNISRGIRHVRIVTPLPDRGAPNLARGTLLAWDESTRTDFSKERTKKPSADEPKLPELIVDRLKMKIDIDFRRTPLQDAFAFIGGEIKTTIDIDGDALKAGGFTKNMPQDFKGDKMPAKEAIAKILERYQDTLKPSNTMVVVLDEGKKQLLITTLAFAEQQKLTPYDIFKK